MQIYIIFQQNISAYTGLKEKFNLRSMIEAILANFKSFLSRECFENLFNLSLYLIKQLTMNRSEI